MGVGMCLVGLIKAGISFPGLAFNTQDLGHGLWDGSWDFDPKNLPPGGGTCSLERLPGFSALDFGSQGKPGVAAAELWLSLVISPLEVIPNLNSVGMESVIQNICIKYFVLKK